MGHVKWDRAEFEKHCEAKACNAYIGNGEAWCRVLGRFKMLVPTRDRSLVPHLLLCGFWESWVTVALARLVKPGHICIDGGANLGYYSLLMSWIAGPKGRVIAVEANPELADYLQETIDINGRRGMIGVVRKALWDEPGRVIDLYVPGEELGGGHCVADGPSEGHAWEVETTTIDSMGLERVDVVKLDIEGAEPRALEGMRETIARNPQMKILVEYAPGVATIGPEMYDQIEALGLSVMLVGTDGAMQKITKSELPGGHSVNMLYLYRSAV